ncbi:MULTISPECIES: C45 family autoproteolytic acyltransferase/hydolase [unclassified Rhizobium]|uniref:C45 family autoproteolytic acyltransferase/hydolase n=1 Tax=unclassified Rhizobium TaxID=2613769 RepID=UPI0010516CC1|nr:MULTISPECIES: C45 family autoproteolytic acyltransferase/hydolase [unclassified Rhizobium]MBB3397855.1 putative choloylglycine hydrolase [Rhizobium sp. BK060]MBB4170857.1 putative choloylglycine hydrolase [Rhizobium sp. BK538]
MDKTFVTAREDRPGEAWLSRFVAGRAEAEKWYFGQAVAQTPTVKDCRAALRHHMPELMPFYESACALVGDNEVAHRMLSHYRPAPERFGCSQAVWLGREGPALVRNFDYPPDIVSDRFEMTTWSNLRVISKAQRPWGGCVDGMNEDGLVASVTLGGSRAQGVGFSIILVIRYILETCHRVDQAVEALCRIPVALPQNVTVLDRSGRYATLFVGPHQRPIISRLKACTNHQRTIRPSLSSLARQMAIHQALEDPSMSLSRLTDLFLLPPLYSRSASSPTLYTAIYRAAEGRVDYIWPGKRWSQSFLDFHEGAYTHSFA